MAESKIPKGQYSNNIYRFEIVGGAVAAGGKPGIIKEYTSNDRVTVSNSNVVIHGSGVALINIHIAGRSGTNNRLWFQIKGSNIEPQHISYGEYATGEITVVTAFNETQIYPKFNDSFDVGAGGVGISCITVILL